MINSVSNNQMNSYYNAGYQQFTPYLYNTPIRFNTYERAPQKQEDNTAKTLGAAALLQAIALLLDKGSSWCSYKLQQGKEFASEADVRKVADSMIKENKLNVDVGYVSETNKAKFTAKYGDAWAKEFNTVAKGENAFFTDTLKLAVAPKSKPSLILHELGHAINATKGKFIKFLQNSRKYAPFAPTALLFLSAMMPPKENGEKNFVQKNAGLLGFAAFLPTIIEEGMASFRGVKAAKNVLGKAAKLGPLRQNYAFALCTYILAGIGLGVAAKETIMRES